jgi:predicted GNAT family acetyltransferase
MTASVSRNDAASRYEVAVEGKVAGHLGFYDHEGRMVLDLTRVDDAFAGQGLAGQLVRAALDDARARGVKVVPMCPYVSGWLSRNPNFEDVVDREMLARIEAGA